MGGGVDSRMLSSLRPGFHLAPGLRVGLYGGSFDPAHGGHAHVARTALRRLRLDKVIWIVSPQNPLKQNRARDHYAKRLAAVAKRAKGPAMIVSDIEARLDLGYSIDTVRWFQRRFRGVNCVWIMGADSLAGFHRWKGWADLMRIIPVAVVSRPGVALRSRGAPTARRFAFARRTALCAATRPPAWVYLTAPFNPASSTALRNNAGS